jgi:hypothetical protein
VGSTSDIDETPKQRKSKTLKPFATLRAVMLFLPAERVGFVYVVIPIN